jgi:hypothetical protein
VTPHADQLDAVLAALSAGDRGLADALAALSPDDLAGVLGEPPAADEIARALAGLGG